MEWTRKRSKPIGLISSSRQHTLCGEPALRSEGAHPCRPRTGLLAGHVALLQASLARPQDEDTGPGDFAHTEQALSTGRKGAKACASCPLTLLPVHQPCNPWSWMRGGTGSQTERCPGPEREGDSQEGRGVLIVKAAPSTTSAAWLFTCP